jgi:hypothetical protein
MLAWWRNCKHRCPWKCPWRSGNHRARVTNICLTTSDRHSSEAIPQSHQGPLRYSKDAHLTLGFRVALDPSSAHQRDVGVDIAWSKNVLSWVWLSLVLLVCSVFGQDSGRRRLPSRIYYDALLGCFNVSYAPAHIWQQTRTNRITYLGLKSQNRAANATN